MNKMRKQSVVSPLIHSFHAKRPIENKQVISERSVQQEWILGMAISSLLQWK
jgi:hypothetical protein